MKEDEDARIKILHLAAEVAETDDNNVPVLLKEYLQGKTLLSEDWSKWLTNLRIVAFHLATESDCRIRIVCFSDFLKSVILV